MCASDSGQLSSTFPSDTSCNSQPDASPPVSKPQEQNKIRVVIADSHRMLRQGLCRLFEVEPDLMVVAEAEDGEAVLAAALRSKPDILLLDMAIPQLTAFEVLQQLSRRGVSVRTLLLAGSCSREQLVHALQLGARGAVLKEVGSEVLAKAIRCVHAGEYWVNRDSLATWAMSAETQPKQMKFGLTPRELEITAEITAGATNKEIATKFAISEQTVKRHLTNVYNKLGVSNRLELALHALHHGLRT
jgi:two-component system, NarL family, nitrate/nitrite response regulator NarL